MSTGISYELVTKQIFQQILDQDSVKTVSVLHDVTLQGNKTSHQIDVYWEFEVGGIRYQTVVQAKDWSRSVEQGELLKLRAVLDDLPGQPRGIMVTRTGYQSGAEDYARAAGILLYELVQIPDRPRGRIVITPDCYITFGVIGLTQDNRLVTETKVSRPTYKHSHFQVDKVSFNEIALSTLQPVTEEIQNRRMERRSNETYFYDENGNQVATLLDIHRQFIKELRDKGELKGEFIKTFDTPTYMRVSETDSRTFRVIRFSTTIEIQEEVSRSIGLPDFIEFILKNLDTGVAETIRVPRSSHTGPNMSEHEHE